MHLRVLFRILRVSRVQTRDSTHGYFRGSSLRSKADVVVELRCRSCKRRLADHNARRQNGGRNFGTCRRAGRTPAAVYAVPAPAATAEALPGAWGPPLTAVKALNTALGQLNNSGSQGGGVTCIDAVNGGYGPKDLAECVHTSAGMQPGAEPAWQQAPQTSSPRGTLHPPPPAQLHCSSAPAAGDHPGLPFPSIGAFRTPSVDALALSYPKDRQG